MRGPPPGHHPHHNPNMRPPPPPHQMQQQQQQRPPQQRPPPQPTPPKHILRVPTAIFDENHLPSVLHQPNPMTPEAERQARRRTCRFIEEAGQRSLRMPRVAISTATVFFHRFYAKHAFQEHDRFEVAMACLLLAGKTEEAPKKLDFVIRECWKLRRKAQQASQQRQLSQQGGDESPASLSGVSPHNTGMSPSTSSSKIDIDPKSEEYIKLKERVLLLERIILHTIGFELSIEHPYKYLVDCVQSLNKKRLLEYSKVPDSGKNKDKSGLNALMVQDLAQNSMNFANDSMHTSLCLQFTAREVGLTCVYLGGKYSNIRPINNKMWIELFDGISIEYMTSIALQILELVQPKKGVDPKDSEMAFKMIRKDLEEMSRLEKQKKEQGSSSEPDAKRQKT